MNDFTPVSVITAASSGAAASGAVAAANHNRQLVNQANVHRFNNSVAVLVCPAYCESSKDGSICQGCDIGTWSKKFLSFEDLVARNAPGFKIDNFVLVGNDFNIYIKEDEDSQ